MTPPREVQQVYCYSSYLRYAILVVLDDETQIGGAVSNMPHQSHLEKQLFPAKGSAVFLSLFG